MAFEKRAPKWDWRKSLTTDEADAVEKIESRCRRIDAERRKLSRDLFMIRNRAMHRAKARAARDVARERGAAA